MSRPCNNLTKLQIGKLYTCKFTETYNELAPKHIMHIILSKRTPNGAEAVGFLTEGETFIVLDKEVRMHSVWVKVLTGKGIVGGFSRGSESYGLLAFDEEEGEE